MFYCSVACVQPVPLSPLPEGVPEQLDVVCNGRQAQLVVRSQRVLFGGQEISASRFEQLCGKGDAKKWKTSVWKTDEEGDADIVSASAALLRGHCIPSAWSAACLPGGRGSAVCCLLWPCALQATWTCSWCCAEDC